MPNGILPTLFIFLEVWKFFRDVSIYFAKGSPFALTILDGHRDESDVGVRRFSEGL